MAQRYVPFLVDLGSGVVPGTVSQSPDTRHPDSDDVWKLICDGGKVTVIAKRDRQTRVIANARWRDGLVVRRNAANKAADLSEDQDADPRLSRAARAGQAAFTTPPGGRSSEARTIAADPRQQGAVLRRGHRSHEDARLDGRHVRPAREPHTDRGAMIRRLALGLVLAGCGRIAFDPLGDAPSSPDVSADAALGAWSTPSPSRCRCSAWMMPPR